MPTPQNIGRWQRPDDAPKQRGPSLKRRDPQTKQATRTRPLFVLVPRSLDFNSFNQAQQRRIYLERGCGNPNSGPVSSHIHANCSLPNQQPLDLSTPAPSRNNTPASWNPRLQLRRRTRCLDLRAPPALRRARVNRTTRPGARPI